MPEAAAPSKPYPTAPRSRTSSLEGMRRSLLRDDLRPRTLLALTEAILEEQRRARKDAARQAPNPAPTR